MPRRPIVLWGLDPLSRSAVTTLVRTLQAAEGDARRLVSFEPQADARRELRDLIADIREGARTLPVAPEPRVALVTASFGADADGRLNRLRDVSDILKATQPGLRSLVLAVLVPPQIADEHEKVETFEFFLRLEELAETVPFLDVIFVNRLPAAFYRHQEGAPDDESLELLARGLCDEELDEAVQGTGRQLIALGTRVSGRKCSYATVGSYRLHYPAADAMRHLEARLGRQLFTSGLMNVAAVDLEQRAAIQARADAFVAHQAGRFEKQLTDAAVRVDGQPLLPLSAEPPLEERVYRFHEEVNQSLKIQFSMIGEVTKELPDLYRGELAAFLGESPLHLAGAKLYADALTGPSLMPPSDERAVALSGGELFDALVCREPLARSLADIVREHIALFARQGEAIPHQDDDEAAGEWLIRSLRGVPSESASPPGAASPARFAAAIAADLADYLSPPSSDPESARALEERLVAAFASEAAALGAVAESRRADARALEDEMRTTFGWIARNVTRRAEREALRHRIADIVAEEAALAASYASMHALLVAMMNRAVLPHMMRARICRSFQDAVRTAARELDAFIRATAGALEAMWQRAAIPELDTTTARSVLTPAKIERLFQMVVQRRGIAELARDLLVFFPRDPARGDRRDLPYGACRHLGDHLAAGAASLIARLEDFSSERCDAVRGLDVLDLVELDDRDPAGEDSGDRAAAYLRDAVDRSRRFLEFSGGMLPLVESQHVMHAIFIVRAARGDRSTLARAYDHLFRPERRYVDTGDRYTIHIACLIVAFPAFLIHALDEGRTLLRARKGTAQGGPEPADLWPEPTAAREGLT
jgi:hypothetical protein